MYKLAVLVVGLILTTGCEMVYVATPASGRVVDARSQQPVAQAEVTRVHSDAPATTKTDAKGHFGFRGKRRLQIAFGDPVLPPVSYRVEAAGYQSFETNRFLGLWANRNGLKADLGTIQMAPK